MAASPPQSPAAFSCADGIDTFEKLPNPFPRIVFASTAWMFLIGILLRQGSLEIIGIPAPVAWDELTRMVSIKRLVFLAYLGLYIAWWGVYLSSRSLGETYQIRALRTLLHHTSALWKPHPTEKTTVPYARMHEAHREKVSVSISTLAMLVSASFFTLTLLLNNFIQTYRDRLFPVVSPGAIPDPRAPIPLPPLDASWVIATLGAAGVVGFVAFVCFVVAVDALDSSLNPFFIAPPEEPTDPDEKKALRRSEEAAAQLKRFLYGQAINRRYLGLVLMMSQLFLVTAHIAPLFAALLVSLALSVGYTYWFPSIVHHNVVLRWAGWLMLFLWVPILAILTADRWMDREALIAIVRPCSAGFLWGASAQFLRIALARLKPAGLVDGLSGLSLSLAVGVLVLGVVSLWNPAVTGDLLRIRPLGVVGALLTFVVAPALYYANTSNTAAHVPQLEASMIKPALSITLALAVPAFALDRNWSWPLIVAAGLVCGGSAWAFLTRISDSRRIVMGIVIAAGWAGGEALMVYPHLTTFTGRADLLSPVLLGEILVALTIAATATAAVYLIAGRGSQLPRDPGAAAEHLRWAGFFVLYGALSFGLAYPLFLQSIASIGLVESVVLAAGAPALTTLLLAYNRVIHSPALAEPPLGDRLGGNKPPRGTLHRISRTPLVRAVMEMPRWAAVMLGGALFDVGARLWPPG